jgi:hypothetical protein
MALVFLLKALFFQVQFVYFASFYFGAPTTAIAAPSAAFFAPGVPAAATAL